MHKGRISGAGQDDNKDGEWRRSQEGGQNGKKVGGEEEGIDHVLCHHWSLGCLTAMAFLCMCGDKEVVRMKRGKGRKNKG